MRASSCGSIMMPCIQSSQCSQARLPSLTSMAGWARFQASSLGVRCQLMPVMVSRFAAYGKPRGVVATPRCHLNLEPWNRVADIHRP